MSRRDLGSEYTRRLNAIDAAEKKLRRAFHAWEKARAHLRSLDRKTARMQAELDALEAGK